MSQLYRVTFIHHSRILFIPLLGTLLYKIQFNLYNKGLISSLWISRKFNAERTSLLKLISKKARYSICRSNNLGITLRDLENEIISDFNVPKELKKLPLEKIYDICWTLVFSKRVTPETKKSLGDFLPENFPETKTIIIPYYDPPDVICDFVFQTVKELAKRGNFIFLVPFAGSKSIFKFFIRKENPIKILGDRFKEYENVIIYQPFAILPLRLNKFEFIKKINDFFSAIHISFLIRRFNKAILWCFDWKDSTILKLNKGFCLSIYDCVDYHTSLDKKRASEIKKNENYLIKECNYFFVNSVALFNVKKNIRKADSIVPQGFDIESFSNNQFSESENVQLMLYKKLFKKFKKPIVGFVGNLSYRIDFNLLDKVIKSLPGISFVFTKSLEKTKEDSNPDKLSINLKKLLSYPNVFFIPRTQNRAVVKEILRNYRIGIIPYDTNLKFNKYCYPMKLFEYFYMGKPVVSTPIVELKRFPSFVKIGKNAKEWEKIINYFLSKPWPKENRLRQKTLAEDNAWSNKVDKILKSLS